MKSLHVPLTLQETQRPGVHRRCLQCKPHAARDLTACSWTVVSGRRNLILQLWCLVKLLRRRSLRPQPSRRPLAILSRTLQMSATRRPSMCSASRSTSTMAMTTSRSGTRPLLAPERVRRRQLAMLASGKVVMTSSSLYAPPICKTSACSPWQCGSKSMSLRFRANWPAWKSAPPSLPPPLQAPLCTGAATPALGAEAAALLSQPRGRVRQRIEGCNRNLEAHDVRRAIRS